jgi:hypothetical protein
MSLIIWFLAIWTCSACSTSWRVASCFFIRQFSCNINGISEGRARSQSSRLGEAIVRAACLLIEQRVFHLPQRPSHALQDIGSESNALASPMGSGGGGGAWWYAPSAYATLVSDATVKAPAATADAALAGKRRRRRRMTREA